VSSAIWMQYDTMKNARWIRVEEQRTAAILRQAKQLRKLAKAIDRLTKTIERKRGEA